MGQNLEFDFVYCQYKRERSYWHIAAIGAVTTTLSIIFVAMMMFLCRRKATKAKKEQNKLLIEMDDYHENIGYWCNRGSCAFILFIFIDI